MPISPRSPVPRTQAGVPPRSSAQWRISSWSVSGWAEPPPLRCEPRFRPPGRLPAGPICRRGLRPSRDCAAPRDCDRPAIATPSRLLLLHGLLLRHAFFQEALGNGGQQAVGLHLFAQGLLEKLRGVAHPELLRQHAGALVAGHLIVLDLAGGADQAGVEDHLLVILLHDLLALFDQALHAVTRFAPGPHVHGLEDLLQPLHLALGDFEVLPEGVLQFLIGRRFCHLGKRADELLFRIEQVLKLLHQELLQTFHLLRHEILPSGRFPARCYECRNSTEARDVHGHTQAQRGS